MSGSEIAFCTESPPSPVGSRPKNPLGDNATANRSAGPGEGGVGTDRVRGSTLVRGLEVQWIDAPGTAGVGDGIPSADVTTRVSTKAILKKNKVPLNWHFECARRDSNP